MLSWKILEEVDTSSTQVVQGLYVRIVVELREASESFADNAFSEEISVVYDLDRDVTSAAFGASFADSQRTINRCKRSRSLPTER